MVDSEEIEMSGPNETPGATLRNAEAGSDGINGSAENTHATSKWYHLFLALDDNAKRRREIHITFFSELAKMGVLKKRPSMNERNQVLL